MQKVKAIVILHVRRPKTRSHESQSHARVCVCLIDDTKLVTPVLLTSKCVVFNWKDTVLKDRILNLLAVLAKAASGIHEAEGDNDDEDPPKIFGHLVNNTTRQHPYMGAIIFSHIS